MGDVNKSLNYLNSDTACLISSTQIITSVSSVVKELFENALDAECTSIHVKLENFGLDLIEVKDDGIGVSGDNVHKMFLAGYTSKISNFNDLNLLSTYGFRGQALGALCTLGEVTVNTKTERDVLAMTYTIDKKGIPTSSTASHLLKGTIMSVKHLFKALPVRKQFISSKKKMAEELRNVETVVQSLAVIHPRLRVVLSHNKNTIWQKNSVNCLKQSFMQIIGLRHAAKMEILEKADGDMKIEVIVPKKDITDADSLFSATASNSFVFVNRRPVHIKKISTVIEDMTKLHWKIIDKHVLFLFSLTVPPHEVDVNLEPNKTKVLLKNLPDVLSLLTISLRSYYDIKFELPKPPNEISLESDEEIPTKRAKLCDSPSLCIEKTILTEDIINKEESSSICSQINKDNCVLASDREVSDLNRILSNNGGKIITCLPNNIVTDDIQTVNVEKMLPPWPIRETAPIAENYHGEINNKNVFNSISNSEIVETVSSEAEQCNPIVQKEKDVISTQEYFDKTLSAMLNSKKEPALSIIDWSRGRVNLGSETILEGGAALLTHANGSAVTKNTISREEKVVGTKVTPRSREVAEDVAKFDLSIQSVSSQMAKKELSGFTKFARIMRPKIIAETPNILFTDVSSMLVERWRALTHDEKEYYENVARAVDEERKNHRQQNAVAAKVSPNTRKEKERKPLSRPKRQEKFVSVSLGNIVKLRSLQTSERLNKLSLIGQLYPMKYWLYYNDLQIGLINNTGLKELVIFQKMMSNFIVPVSKLNRHQHLTKFELGEKLWDILTSLDTEESVETLRHTVISPVVVKNGFSVEFIKTKTGEITAAFLTAVAVDLIDYGVENLKEALQLYHQFGEFAPMQDLRTSAVKTYIQEEVKRIVREDSCIPGREEITSMLCTWRQSLSHLQPKCLHEKEIFIPIHCTTISQVLSEKLDFS